MKKKLPFFRHKKKTHTKIKIKFCWVVVAADGILEKNIYKNLYTNKHITHRTTCMTKITIFCWLCCKWIITQMDYVYEENF